MRSQRRASPVAIFDNHVCTGSPMRLFRAEAVAEKPVKLIPESLLEKSSGEFIANLHASSSRYFVGGGPGL